MKRHLALLGDSILDNGSYVPGEEPVVEHVREALDDWPCVTLLAVDGHVSSDVIGQLDHLPQDATHVVVSAGGNDALQSMEIFDRRRGGTLEIFTELSHVQEVFRKNYRTMLEEVLAKDCDTAVCTIYDQIPFRDPALPRPVVALLSIFNDSIIREAGRLGVPVLDLREVCQDADDFSELSPIEPSCQGGLKIAYAIARLLRDHDFSKNRSGLYS